MGGWYELTRRRVLRGSRVLADRDRGQSQVIGAILIFGFVIAGLGLYQVTVVPQQNSEIELDHSEGVDADFDEIHSAISNAGSTNEPRTTTIKLGMRYPARALTLNPAPVSGRIAIRDLGGNIGGTGFNPADVCGSSSISPKTLTYEADYNRLNDAGQHGYETSVTYERTNGKIVDSSQVLIQGTTIRLLPLTQGSVSTTGIGSEVLQFEPGTTGGETRTGALVISLPTDLTADQWRTILADQEKVMTGSITKSGGTVDIPLQSDSYAISCTPIGEQEQPGNSPAKTSDESAINPVGPGAFELTSVSTTGSAQTLTFANNDVTRSRTVSKIRVPYANSPGNSGSTLTFTRNGVPVLVTIGSSGTATGSTTAWTWSPGSTGSPVEVTGSGSSNPNTGYAVVFVFSDGSSETYFVSNGNTN